jgi:GTP cyclohydrolase I
MKDVQNMTDHRNIDIDRVGIKNIKYPITVKDRANGIQHTVADINMYVDLPRSFKGTHMSRFVESLNLFHGNIDITRFAWMLQHLKKRLHAGSAHIEMSFPYFISKKAPVTGSAGLLDYRVTFKAAINSDDELDQIIEIQIPTTTLCPCSKEISSYGAHNQRSIITLAYRANEFIWIEDMIEMAESGASCELYPLLKREDEKYVTEKAYDNPAFVEDVVRNITVKLSEDGRIVWFKVESENFESIHNHSAYAYVERDKRAQKTINDLVNAGAAAPFAPVYPFGSVQDRR